MAAVRSSYLQSLSATQVNQLLTLFASEQLDADEQAARSTRDAASAISKSVYENAVIAGLSIGIDESQLLPPCLQPKASNMSGASEPIAYSHAKQRQTKHFTPASSWQPGLLAGDALQSQLEDAHRACQTIRLHHDSLEYRDRAALWKLDNENQQLRQEMSRLRGELSATHRSLKQAALHSSQLEAEHLQLRDLLLASWKQIDITAHSAVADQANGVNDKQSPTSVENLQHVVSTSDSSEVVRLRYLHHIVVTLYVQSPTEMCLSVEPD